MDTLGFFYFDFRYFIYLAPAILFAMWAQMKVKSAYAQASKRPASSGLSGAEAAQRILNYHGISNVSIEAAKSFLGDHYDPRHKVLRLSPEVYQGRSLASLGIAAHEVGHAIQDANAYGPLAIRNGLVPMASIGSQFSMGLIILGLIGSYFIGPLGQTVAVVGLGLFGVVVVFQLINLPVEFNASSRARQILLANGMVTAAENKVVGKVLNAAALTYVAATATAILTMVYYASLVLGRRH